MNISPEQIIKVDGSWYKVAEIRPTENSEVIITANLTSEPDGADERGGLVRRVCVKPLEWKAGWSGENDDIPVWHAMTPWGRVSASFAGKGYESHADVPAYELREKLAEKQSDYERRIMSTLSPAPAVAGWREAVKAARIAVQTLSDLAHVRETEADAMSEWGAAWETFHRVKADQALASIREIYWQGEVSFLSASPAPAPAADAVVEALRDIKALLRIVADEVLVDDEADDASVGWKGDGSPLPMTFGHVRRAIKAVDTLAALQPSTSPQEAFDADALEIRKVLEAGEEFGFDPATGFFHADDGGAPASCIFYAPRQEPTRDAMAQEATGGVVDQANAIASSAFTWLKDAKLTEEQTDMVHGAIQVAARAALSARTTPQAGDESPAFEALLADGSPLIRDLVIEAERAIRQRDECTRTGISTAAHGGSHDTCFGVILAKHLRPRIKALEARAVPASEARNV